jgi:hypothetical protein
VIERINGALSLPPVGPAIARDPGSCKSGTLSAPAERKPMAYKIAGVDVHKKHRSPLAG